MAYNVKSYKKSGFCKRNPDLAIFHKVSQGCSGSTEEAWFRRQNIQDWVLFLRIEQNRRMGTCTQMYMRAPCGGFSLALKKVPNLEYLDAAYFCQQFQFSFFLSPYCGHTFHILTETL